MEQSSDLDQFYRFPLTFDRVPPVGTLAVYQGQEYRFTHDEPYVRRDGVSIRLLNWTARCFECGRFSVFKGSLTQESPTRRCYDCAIERKTAREAKAAKKTPSMRALMEGRQHG